MAMFDSMDILDRLGLRTNASSFGGASAAAPASAPAPAATPAAAVNPAYERGRRLAELAKTRVGSVLGGVSRAVPGVVLATEGASDLATGNTAGGVARVATGLGALTGVPGRAFAGGVLGGELAASGVAALAGDGQKQILSPEFQKTVQAAGGTNQFVQGVQDRTIASFEAADAAAQKVTDARTSRVNEVIEASRAGRAEDAKMAREDRILSTLRSRPEVERPELPTFQSYGQTPANLPDINRLPAVRQMLETRGLRGTPGVTQANVNAAQPLASLFGLTAGYVGERDQARTYNRAAQARYNDASAAFEKAEGRGFTAEQKALDRGLTREEGAANRAVDEQKILAQFKKALKPGPVKLATLKGAPGSPEPQAVVDESGRLLSSISVDDKGNVFQREPLKEPTKAEIRSAMQKRVDTAKNPAKEKAIVNEELKRRGLPLL